MESAIRTLVYAHPRTGLINVKGFLRPIAAELGITTDSEAGIRLNTQQQGATVIRVLNERSQARNGAHGHG